MGLEPLTPDYKCNASTIRPTSLLCYSNISKIGLDCSMSLPFFFLMRFLFSLCRNMSSIHTKMISLISELSLQKNDLPSLLPILDASHRGLRGVCHQGCLFVLGGFYCPQMERTFSDDVLFLCEKESKWERKQPMLIPRTGFAVISYGKSVF